MFAVCLVRAIGLTIDGNTGTIIDLVWGTFWLLSEASVAMMVVSMIAFRSLYGIKTMQERQGKKKGYKSWLSSYRRNLLTRKKQRRVDEFGDPVSLGRYSLPRTPSAKATLIGARTTFDGMPVTSTHGDPISINEAHQEKEELDSIKTTHNLDCHDSMGNHNNSLDTVDSII